MYAPLFGYEQPLEYFYGVSVGKRSDIIADDPIQGIRGCQCAIERGERARIVHKVLKEHAQHLISLALFAFSLRVGVDAAEHEVVQLACHILK